MQRGSRRTGVVGAEPPNWGRAMTPRPVQRRSRASLSEPRQRGAEEGQSRARKNLITRQARGGGEEASVAAPLPGSGAHASHIMGERLDGVASPKELDVRGQMNGIHAAKAMLDGQSPRP